MNRQLRIGTLALAALAIGSPAAPQGVLMQDESFTYAILEGEPDNDCGLPGTLQTTAQYGTISLFADGSAARFGSATFVCDGGSSTTDVGGGVGAYTIAADGSLSLDFDLAAPGTDVAVVHLRFDHAVFTYATGTSSEPLVLVALRRTASAPTVVGSYYVARLALGAGVSEARSEAGVLTVGAAGNWSETGTRHSVTSAGAVNGGYSAAGSLAVAADGTLNVSPGGMRGAASADGRLLFWVDDTGPELALTVAVLADGSSGPVQGSWWRGSLAGAPALPALSSTAASVAASAGSWSLSGETRYADPAGAVLSPYAGSGSASTAAGGVTNLLVDGVAELGGLGANGSFLVAADVSSPGRAGISLTFRECVAPVPYGTATAGTGAIAPTLSSSGGLPLLGNAAFALEVAAGVGAAPGFVFVATGPFPGLPFAGGTLWIDLGLVGPVLPVTLSGSPGAPGAGAATVPFAIPASPGLAGAQLFAQAVLLDAAAPASLSMTPGLALRLCD